MKLPPTTHPLEAILNNRVKNGLLVIYKTNKSYTQTRILKLEVMNLTGDYHMFRAASDVS